MTLTVLHAPQLPCRTDVDPTCDAWPTAWERNRRRRPRQRVAAARIGDQLACLRAPRTGDGNVNSTFRRSRRPSRRWHHAHRPAHYPLASFFPLPPLSLLTAHCSPCSLLCPALVRRLMPGGVSTVPPSWSLALVSGCEPAWATCHPKFSQCRPLAGSQWSQETELLPLGRYVLQPS